MLSGLNTYMYSSFATTTVIVTVNEYGYGIDYGVAYGGGSVSSSRTAMTTQLTTSTSENLAQRLLIRLRTFRGEWFLDEYLGIVTILVKYLARIETNQQWTLSYNQRYCKSKKYYS